MSVRIFIGAGRALPTCVSRLGDDLTKELSEVRQILAQERSLNNKSLPGVV